jgi:hypothetical protein
VPSFPVVQIFCKLSFLSLLGFSFAQNLEFILIRFEGFVNSKGGKSFVEMYNFFANDLACVV